MTYMVADIGIQEACRSFPFFDTEFLPNINKIDHAYKMLSVDELHESLITMLQSLTLSGKSMIVDNPMYQERLAILTDYPNEPKLLVLQHFFKTSIYFKELTDAERARFTWLMNIAYANYKALYLAENRSDEFSASDVVLITHNEIPEDSVFIWIDDLMIMSEHRNTLTISGQSLYSRFVNDFENEPAYIIGKMITKETVRGV